MKINWRPITAPFLFSIIVLMIWLATFAFAISDCSIRDVLTGSCSVVWPVTSPTATKETKEEVTEKREAMAALMAAKGQLGDTFGIFNGLIGSITILLVFLTYRTDKESTAKTLETARQQVTLAEENGRALLANAAEQLRLAQLTRDEQYAISQRERYLNSVDTAAIAYTSLLNAVHVVEVTANPYSPPRSGRDALWSLWASFVVEQGVRHNWGGNSTYRPWEKIELQTKNALVSAPATAEFWESLVNQKVDQPMILANTCSAWLILYATHRHQLDALFRAWFYVCKAVSRAELYGVDAQTEWETASGFRAQLSSVELTLLLVNQQFSQGADGAGYPLARTMSERYAFFDNLDCGLDPAAHVCRHWAEHSDPTSSTSKFNPSAFKSVSARTELFQFQRRCV